MGACSRIATLVALGWLLPAVRGADQEPLPSLSALAAQVHLLVGTAVKAEAIRHDARYREVLLRHFTVITPENEMKFKRVRPSRDRFEFSDADSIVAFAQKHQLRVRGHTLVWTADSHLPAWLQSQPVVPEVAMSLMQEHIAALMGRFRGRVQDWDVVNEAVSNDNREGASALVDGYWRRALGEDYIGIAFRLAHAADPTARLFYNDYDHGASLGPKSDRIYSLLQKLVAAGVPINGVGLQMHCNIVNPPEVAAMVANFRRLAALGLVVQVTELDVEIMTAQGPLAERLERQAQVYRDVCAAARLAGVEAVVTWGFTDKFRQTGLLARKGLAGDTATPLWLFDQDFEPKPAFHAVVAALRSVLPPVQSP